MSSDILPGTEDKNNLVPLHANKRIRSTTQNTAVSTMSRMITSEMHVGLTTILFWDTPIGTSVVRVLSENQPCFKKRESITPSL